MKTIMQSVGTSLLAALALAMGLTNLPAKEIKVPSGSILTIQQGVDAAAPGDKVTVLPGVYGIVTIGPNKPGLQLKTAGPPGSVQVVGLGGLVWNVGIDVQANDVSVQGFVISEARYGIRVVGTSHGVTITGNTIGNLPGPYAAAIRVESSDGVEVGQNTAFGSINGDGVIVYMSSNIHIGHNGVDFIILTDSTGCEVDHNTVESGGIFLNNDGDGPSAHHHVHHNEANGAQIGIFVWDTADCTLDHNDADHNSLFGIYIASSPNCDVDHNKADHNSQIGIYIGSSPNCTVNQNQANANGESGIQVEGSCGSSFGQNSAHGNGHYDLFAPAWGDPTCSSYSQNKADTASPSLALWDVK
jgi:parallel beta-helix repeat protein